MASPSPATNRSPLPEPATTAGWTARRERGSTTLLRAMTWVALHWGRRFARLLLWPTTLYYFFFGGAARSASRAWLDRALPHPAGWRDGIRHVFSFAAVTLDRLYFLNGQWSRFELHVHGADCTRGHAQPGIFMLGAHVGSFEAVRAVGHRAQGIEVALLMYEENARKIGEAMAAINPRAAQEIIALGRIDSMLRLRDRLDQGVVVGMLADRTLADDDETLQVPFFGAAVGLPAGPFRLAAILRRPIVLMLGLYGGGNRYDIHFEPIYDFSLPGDEPRAARMQHAAERYAARLEHFCRLYPYNWFNFYDFWRS